jgi:exodeoxyribonuclease V alpha subunit
VGILQSMDWEAGYKWLDGIAPVPLTQEQKNAVKMAITQKVCILTGGPGTGKSTVAGSIIQLAKSFGQSVLLTAPTGRAAKRLTEATGMDAMTIHRLLEFTPVSNDFKKNRKNLLNTDLLIVDETSMVDIILANHLLDAIADGTHILFIGDQDQLPSVGAGNVLRDMIDSGVVPVLRLMNIFRQSEDSFIIENAHRINRGEMPVFSKNANDFYLFAMEDPQKVEDWIIDIVANRIINTFGVKPQDIQVLSPMYRGPAGVSMLNKRLQEKLNPPRRDKTEYRSGERLFRKGDRVMQLRNNYDKLVFNGDIGTVNHVELEDQWLEIDFEGRHVSYEFSQLDEIQLAYTISIHKSQGSEFPVVVLPMLTNHFILLQRNLLYTAVTRAKRIVVLVGSKRAISIAVKNNRTAERNTRLAELLRDFDTQIAPR